ncbi:hypothetical protein CcaCcLH18_10664 [Colletotrichum camelliae]|nr:hypothetical protein CcaCcLH18_10664 [Colletotrichum camelliae]
MRVNITILLACLAHVLTALCDKLTEYGYKVAIDGEYWEVSRDGGLIDQFSIEPGRIKVYKAWNKFDRKPRLPLRDIMVYIWVRADKSLSDLDSVQIVDVNNPETKAAIAEARTAAEVDHPEDMLIEYNKPGWTELTASPFYMSVNKMCNEWNSLDGKSITSMRVMSLEGSLDDLVMYIS